MAQSSYQHRIKAARSQLRSNGFAPEGMLPGTIERSWSRCATTGLSIELQAQIEPLPTQALNEIKEQNSQLLYQARPEMESLQAQILGTDSMVILTDARGTILHTLGDAAFIDKARRVALQPGVSWREEITGTNAIGTALVEGAPVMVMGGEHYFEQNTFLSCSASPIVDAHGQTIGVLDVSGDYRRPQAHTMALVQMSAQMIENRLLTSEFSSDITMHFHMRPEFIGTLWEGIAVFSPEGKLLAINKSGLFQLGLNNQDYRLIDFSHIFDIPLANMLDIARRALPRSVSLTMHTGIALHAKVDPGVAFLRTPEKPAAERPERAEANTRLLDAMDSGDPMVSKTIATVKKIVNRNIPILIEGETGTGKELLAKAIHQASARHTEPFVAINCASIPEGLIEAELFGYEEGAFTGAKRKGVQGKIVLANGGTLFLDEIGEMPTHLQARLLRVLQEREIVPLGSSKGIPVDIALISATNRKLRDHVAQGYFREDLYYRLNGLRVTLPPLRERNDLDILIQKILKEEQGSIGIPAALDKTTASLLTRHPWRGNIRQLRNVLRAALAMAGHERFIQKHHLPEDFIEELSQLATNPTTSDVLPGNSMQHVETALIKQALNDHAQNVTAAARQLGISRATLYRKIKQLNATQHSPL